MIQPCSKVETVQFLSRCFNRAAMESRGENHPGFTPPPAKQAQKESQTEKFQVFWNYNR